jgi:hypothetical protein
MVGFEGSRIAVAWQVARLQEELSPEYRFLVRPDAEALRDFQLLAESPLSPASRLTFKANLLPSAVAAFLQTARALKGAVLCAHAGSGIVIGHLTDDLTLDRARTMLKTLQDAATAAQGNLILFRCPPAWKRELPVWGSPRGDGWLMRAVKDKLDPKCLFNPGRFVDGI